MPTHRFKLVFKDITSLDDVSEEDLDRIYASGSADSTIMSSGGEACAWFDREAPALDEAIKSAVADLRRAGFEVDESKTEVEA
jgi:hypothetical protein